MNLTSNLTLNRRASLHSSYGPGHGTDVHDSIGRIFAVAVASAWDTRSGTAAREKLCE